ncbi:cation:proton antiporter [Moheibacter stercoris]|uniref:Kef-type K+ transport system membrane component KefB n=1 Tax=Moheibacter stercoris TaxID=1628251 RepID=A0ABV2LSZ2_9FLAO
MLLLSLHDLTLPITDPVLKFLLVLIIILFAPLILNKFKIPHLIGLILAGAIIGPNGFNVLERDSSIVVTGTTGLLYIMFLAGLEIDMGDFKRNKWKSLGFGLYTFLIPFALGFICGYFILGFDLLISILFASLFSSHTLISYPLVSKFGIAKNKAVNITVGGTMITDILALLVLAACVGMAQGEVGSEFWIRMGISIAIFGAIVLIIFPIISRWFFKNVEDKISQYIFVLVIIYLASLLAEIAGIEAIIGAFLAGLALNRLIPHTSSLMNRVEFVGNAIFIPFFLISVGMIIDFKVFFSSFETIGVAIVMLICSIGGKYLAARLTQKTFRFSKLDGNLIFGLSTASAAATLAAVMVGYNIIISENEAGEPIRLLNEHVLNGSILLILVSCTVSSFVSANNAEKIAELENEDTLSGDSVEQENLLLALNYPKTIEPLVNLAVMIKSKNNQDGLYALNIINEEKNESSVKNAEKILGDAVHMAAAADTTLTPVTRYDNDVINGVNNVIKEQKITDLLVALDPEKGFTTSFLYNLYNGYFQNKSINILIYHAAQPISTIKKQIVILPENAHLESGFFHAMLRVWNIARNSGAQLQFYASQNTLTVLKRIHQRFTIEAKFETIPNWMKLQSIYEKVGENDGLIVFMAKRGMKSYLNQMQYIPSVLNAQFSEKNYLLIYPFDEDRELSQEVRSINNHGDFEEIGKIVKKLF